MHPQAGLAFIDAGHLQHDLAVGAGGVGNRVAARRGAVAFVAEGDVLAGPEAHGRADRAQAQLDDARRARDAVGDHEALVLARRKEFGFGVFRAPLDNEFFGQRLGHAHQAEALGALVLRERHVEHHALVEVA